MPAARAAICNVPRCAFARSEIKFVQQTNNSAQQQRVVSLLADCLLVYFSFVCSSRREAVVIVHAIQSTDQIPTRRNNSQ